MLIRRIIRVLFACLIGAIAGIATVIVAAPIARTEPFWAAETVIGAAAAAAWMSVGLLVARGEASIAAPLLFVTGAATAWFLTRGIVHSVSPYYGLFPFALACFSGGAVWFAQVGRKSPGISRAATLAVPLIALASGYQAALFGVPLGNTRSVVGADSTAMRLPVVSAATDDNSQWYVWSPADLNVAADSSVYIEFDPGSGAAHHRIGRVRDARTVASACVRFRAQTQNAIDSEIDRGSTPPFMRRLPVFYEGCEEGQVWMTADEPVLTSNGVHE